LFRLQGKSHNGKTNTIFKITKIIKEKFVEVLSKTNKIIAEITLDYSNNSSVKEVAV
jgi:hypothetical protein